MMFCFFQNNEKISLSHKSSKLIEKRKKYLFLDWTKYWWEKICRPPREKKLFSLKNINLYGYSWMILVNVENYVRDESKSYPNVWQFISSQRLSKSIHLHEEHLTFFRKNKTLFFSGGGANFLYNQQNFFAKKKTLFGQFWRLMREILFIIYKKNIRLWNKNF